MGGKSEKKKGGEKSRVGKGKMENDMVEEGRETAHSRSQLSLSWQKDFGLVSDFNIYNISTYVYL